MDGRLFTGVEQTSNCDAVTNMRVIGVSLDPYNHQRDIVELRLPSTEYFQFSPDCIDNLPARAVRVGSKDLSQPFFPEMLSLFRLCHTVGGEHRQIA